MTAPVVPSWGLGLPCSWQTVEASASFRAGVGEKKLPSPYGNAQRPVRVTVDGVFNDKQDPHPEICYCDECYEVRQWFKAILLSIHLKEEPGVLEVAHLILDTGYGGSVQEIIAEARRLYDPDA